MKQAKAVMMLLSLMIILVMAGTSKAQVTANDYFGLWTGQDNFKNNIEITLNSNYSCIFKVDGVLSYNITGYKIIFDGDNDGISNPAKCGIWFYSSNASSAPTSLTLAPTSPTVIYKAYSNLGGNNLDELILTGDLPNPGGNSVDNANYTITLNK